MDFASDLTAVTIIELIVSPRIQTISIVKLFSRIIQEIHSTWLTLFLETFLLIATA